MRFSAVQEDGYGVGLPQDRFPDNVDENMMAATGELEHKDNESTEETPMVSNLPLLFANGYPTSLEKITLAQLERFITFMVQCSLGHDTAEVIRKPQWWPTEVKFSNPLVRPKHGTDNWMANLKKLVFRCYTYHRSEYLLRFCSYLAKYPQEELEYVNNWDCTTSLFHKSTKKLLVTFRNENMNYDKKNDSPRRKLLVHNGATSNSANKSKQQQHSLIMVQPPSDDIYLCDNCDAEFVGLKKMKEHERVCCVQEHVQNNSRPATPEITMAEPELEQNKFLGYFELASKNVDNKPVETKTLNAVNEVVKRTSNRIRGSINLTKCRSIPFSSPAGLLLAKKSKAMTAGTQQERLDRLERHLPAPALKNTSVKPKWLDREPDRERWVVTYRPNREKPSDEYVHEYNFNYHKNKPMLSIRSQLMYLVCRPVSVVLSRLSEEQLEEMKKNPSKYESSVKRTLYREKAKSFSLSRSRTNHSIKRKASVDENMESSMKENFTIKEEKLSPDLSNKNITTPTMSKDNKTCSKAARMIPFINLCSSDEEDDLTENRDPMNSTDTPTRKSLPRRLTQGKLSPKTCDTNSPGCPKTHCIDTPGEWIVDNLLNNEKFRNGVVINGCTRITPVFRPAP